MSTPRTRIERGTSAGGRWEIATRAPGPLLEGYVATLGGYDERTSASLARRELPGPNVVVILGLGAPLRIDGARHGAFVAGIDRQSMLTQHDGWQRGVQIDLPPATARRVFGVALGQLGSPVTSLCDLLPRDERHLVDALAEAPSWEARLDHVEAFLVRALARGAPTDRRIAWALRYIHARAGNASIAALRTELGVSEKHLVELFRTHIGTTPKRYARLVRFDRVRKRLMRGAPQSWAALAAELGFADQAHLAREVRALASATPVELATSLSQGLAQACDASVMHPDAR